MDDKLKALQAPLQIRDIDFRVQSINKGGYATILAYKDARVDMKRLDEVLGIGYWQRDVKIVEGVLYGGVGVYNSELKEWVWKWDAGAETYSDKEKGQSSDAFKRACFNLGIGRELYNYPVIQVKLNGDEFKVDGTKAKATWNLKLKEWKWLSQFDDDGQVTFLAAKDTSGTIRFKWGTFDKDREEVESLASGTPMSNPEEHEEDAPAPFRGTTDEEEKGDVSALTKKTAEPTEESPTEENKEEPTEEQVRWNELAQKYEIMFGKKPRANTKIETLEAKIAEETANREAKKEEEEEPTSGEVYSDSGEEADEETEEEVASEEKVIDETEEESGEDPYADDKSTLSDEAIDLLSKYQTEMKTYKDREKFVAWARGAVEALTGMVSDDEVKDFKKSCQEHYESI
jgi:hypothetical protein